METNKLNQAIQYIKSGNKQSALPLLKEVVQSEPKNELAWLWLYACLDSYEQKKYCLQKAIEINPNNQNSRKTLEKLLEQQNPPILQHAQNKEQPIEIRQSSAVKKQPPVSKQTKKTSSKKFFIAGILGLFLLFCIGLGFIGGNWLVDKYSSLPQNDPDAIVETLSSFPQDVQDTQNFAPSDNNAATPSEFVQPENSQQNPIQPSATPTPPPDVRFSPYYAERIDGVAVEKTNENYETYTEYDTSQGLDTFIVYLKIENHSDKIIVPEMDFPTVVTDEGYEYYSECNMSKEEYRMLIPQTRAIYLHVRCEIPELTTGHKFIFKYKLTSPKEKTFLFDLNSEFISILDTGQITDSIRESFNSQGIQITQSATIEVQQPSNKWAIVDSEVAYPVYIIRNEQQALNIYRGHKNDNNQVYEDENEHVWEDLSFEFPFTPTEASAVNPFMKSYRLGEYQNNQIILRHFGETFTIGDIDILFEAQSDTDINIKINNKFIGGEAAVSLIGLMYLPDDEQTYTCSFYPPRINPAGAYEQTFSVGSMFSGISSDFTCDRFESVVHSFDYTPKLYEEGTLYSHDIYAPTLTFPVGACFLWREITSANSEHAFYSGDNARSGEYIMVCRDR